jgi:hypothetical protein
VSEGLNAVCFVGMTVTDFHTQLPPLSFSVAQTLCNSGVLRKMLNESLE